MQVQMIKDRYARMDDWELRFTAKEVTSLSQDAYIILKREMRKRNFDPEEIKALEDCRINNKKGRIIENLDREDLKQMLRFWELAFDSKFEKKPDNAIIELLMDEGLEVEDAIWLVERLSSRSRIIMARESRKMYRGLAFLFVGIVALLIVVSSNIEVRLSVYYFIGFLVFGGGARFFSADKFYQKHKMILEIIEEEREIGTTRGQ